MNMRFSVVSTHFYRGQIAGHLVRVQVHRNVGGHQSQCGRAAGRSAVADPAEAGESGEVAVGVLCLSGQLYHHQLTPLVFLLLEICPLVQRSVPEALLSQAQTARLLATGQRLSGRQRRNQSADASFAERRRRWRRPRWYTAHYQRCADRQRWPAAGKRLEHTAEQCAKQVNIK